MQLVLYMGKMYPCSSLVPNPRHYNSIYFFLLVFLLNTVNINARATVPDTLGF